MKGLSRKRFDEIYRQGHRHTSRHYRMYKLPGEGRFGVATARSIGCHACRNRERRRAGQAFDLTRPDQACGWDVVVAVSPASRSARFHDLLQEARCLWNEAICTWADKPASS